MSATTDPRNTTNPTSGEPVTDVHDMIVIHRLFRRELAAVPRLVGAVHDGDVNRARTVAAHVDLVLSGLRIHHTGEDVVLWPLLYERAEAAPLVATMEAQHERIATSVGAATALVPEWAGTGATEVGDRLAATLDRLAGDSIDHLDLEEREILPLAARHITPAEWKRIGEHGREAMSRVQLPLMFGAILEDADAGERAAIFAEVPAPVRWYLRTIGARQYRRHITSVREVG